MFLFDRCNLGKFLYQPRESSTAYVYLMWHRKLFIQYFGCRFFPSLVYTILPKIHSMKYENTKIISYLIKYLIDEIKLVIDEKMLKYFYNNPEVSYYWKCIKQRLKKYTIHLRNNFSCLITNGGFNIVYKRMKTFKPSLLLTEFNQAEKEVSDSQVQYKKVEMEFTQDAETKNILYV